MISSAETPGRSSREAGFTLLELLVAVAILSIIAGALYGAYFTVMRGRNSAQQKVEQTRETAGTLDLLRREIASALYRKDNPRLRFVVEDRDWFGKPASNFILTCLGAPSAGKIPASDQREVRYGPVEREGKLLLARGEKEIFAEGDPQLYPQMEEIHSFLVECWDGGRWVRTWDAAVNGRLPDKVRVTLRLPEGDKGLPYTLLVATRLR